MPTENSYCSHCFRSGRLKLRIGSDFDSLLTLIGHLSHDNNDFIFNWPSHSPALTQVATGRVNRCFIAD